MKELFYLLMPVHWYRKILAVCLMALSHLHAIVEHHNNHAHNHPPG